MKRSLSLYPRMLLALLAAHLSLALQATAQGADTPGSHDQHVLLNASDINWGTAPPSLPPGAQAAVIEGNPAEAGPFTLRLRLPADYRIAPHWHPGVEHVTVLSGTFHLGMGEQVDTKAGTALAVGGFMAMPPKTPHFAWTTEETVIQLHGVGPWGITYVNPEDDPRNKAQ